MEQCDDGLFIVRISDGEVRLLAKQGMKVGDKISGRELKLVYIKPCDLTKMV